MLNVGKYVTNKLLFHIMLLFMILTDPDRNKSQKDSARSSTSQDTERSSTGRDTERPSTNRDTERPSTSGDPVGTSRPWSKRSMFGTTVEEELASMRGKSTLNREKISFNDPPRDPPREESRDDRGEESKRKKLVRVKEVQGRKSRSQSPLPVRRDLLSGTAERPVSPKLPARSRERSASPSVSSPSQASMSTVGGKVKELILNMLRCGSLFTKKTPSY